MSIIPCDPRKGPCPPEVPVPSEDGQEVNVESPAESEEEQED